MTSAVSSRRVAAVVGALTADAAIQPLHWIYDEEKLLEIIGEKQEVEFWEPSQNPFYRIANGLQSSYGDQPLVILKSMVENKGVDCKSLKQRTYEWFGPNSAYEDPENAKYAIGKENKGAFPIPRPWRNASIKHFLANMDVGKDVTGSESDDQADCFVRIVPVCALYAGHPDMLRNVEAVLRVTQNLDLTVSFGLAAARILEQFILNGQMQSEEVLSKVLADVESGQDWHLQEQNKIVAEHLRSVQECLKLDHHTAVTQHFKKDCHLPGSFQSAVHGALTAKDFTQAVRSTLKVGGCNASRGGFIGACAAAQFGLDSIPKAWLQKTKSYPEILELAKKLSEITL